jgi:hypothetical protein
VTFLSSLIQIGPFTAANAGQRNDHQEGDIKLLTSICNLFFPIFFSFFQIFEIGALLLTKPKYQGTVLSIQKQHTGPVVQLV